MSDLDGAKSIEGLVRILENMLFSMPISEEIMEKYNFIKEKKYKQIGIPFVPINKLQYPSIGTVQKQEKDSEKFQEIEEIFINIYDCQASVFEAIFNDIIGKGNAILELIKNPKVPIKQSTINVNETKMKLMRLLKEYQQRKSATIQIDKSQSLRLTELIAGRSLSDIASQILYKIELTHHRGHPCTAH